MGVSPSGGREAQPEDALARRASSARRAVPAAHAGGTLREIEMAEAAAAEDTVPPLSPVNP